MLSGVEAFALLKEFHEYKFDSPPQHPSPSVKVIPLLNLVEASVWAAEYFDKLSINLVGGKSFKTP